MKLPKLSLIQVFSAVCISLLIFFLVIVVFSTYLYTNPLAIFSALLSDEIRFSIILTLFTATIATILAVIVSIPAAYALAKSNFKGRNVVDALLNIPIALPPIALGTALLIFFTNTPTGIFLNEIFHFVFNIPGIILAQFVVISPLLVRMLKPVFEGIDPRYVKIARTLGHTETQSFFRIVLPLAKNGVFGGTALAWARAMGEFGATVTLAGATRVRTEVLSIAIYLNMAQADIEAAMAIILILIVLTVPTLLIGRKIMDREQIA